MSSINLMASDYTIPSTYYFSLPLDVPAGVYPFCSALVDSKIDSVVIWNGVSAADLTSLSIASDDTTPIAVLSSTLLAALTGGKNLTPFTTPFHLASGKKLDLTIVGDGTAGTLVVGVQAGSYRANEAPLLDSSISIASFEANLCQEAGTYDLCTATGDVAILGISFTCTVPGAAPGITSVSMATTNTSPETILASVLAEAITDGAVLTPYAVHTALRNTKKIQYSIVGDGSGDTGNKITATIQYASASGVSLA